MDGRSQAKVRLPFIFRDVWIFFLGALVATLAILIADNEDFAMATQHRFLTYGFLSSLLLCSLFGLSLLLFLGKYRNQNQQLTREIQGRLKAEEALRRAEATLTIMLDSVPIGIASMKGRRYLEVNEAFARIFQRDRSEFLGQSARMAYASDEAFEAAGTLLYSTASAIGAVETQAQRADGSTVPLLIRIAPLKLEGAADEFITIALDLSQQKATESALRNSEAMLKLVLDTMPQAVFWKDRAGTYLGCNEAFARAAGCRHSTDITGRNDFDMPWGAKHGEAYRTDDRTVVASGKTKQHFCEPFQDAAGRDLWLDTTKVPLEDANGDMIGVLGIFEDITRRKSVEDELAQSRLFTDAVMDSIPGLVYVFDIEGRPVRWNKRAEALTGYSAEELKSLHMLDWIGDAEETQRLRAAIQRVAQEGHAEAEAHLTMKDGRSVPYHLTGMQVTIGGQPYMVAVGLDMTERQKAEEEIQQNQERFRAIFEASPFTITLTELKTDLYIDVNTRFCEVLGLKKKQIIGKTAEQLGLILEEETKEKALQIMEQGGVINAMNIKVNVPRIGGRDVLMTARRIPMGGKPCMLVMAVDITEWKRSELAIQESERRLRTLFEGSPIGIFSSTPEGYFMQVNPALAAMFCYENPRSMVQEVNHHGIAKGLYESLDQRSKLMQRLHSNLGTWFVEEIHFRRRDGTFMDGIMSIILHPDPVTGLPLLFGFVQDISERKRSEREILHLQNYLANVIDYMPSVMVGLDCDGRVTGWNRAAEELLGVSAREAQGRPIEDLAKDFAPWITVMRREIQQEHRPASLEKLLLEREGARNFYELMLYPLVMEGVEGSVVRIQDVTERVRIQELMVQTEKMMSVGGLAAGMAHEINNPLGIIGQAAQNIERRLSMDLPANRTAAQDIGLDLGLLQAYFNKRKIFQFMDNIREAVDRAARIVSNMLQFSRQVDSVRHPASLTELLETAMELAANDYALKQQCDFRSIEVHREFEPGLPSVPVVVIEIEQVFLNLLKNAAQAMAINPPGKRPCLILRAHRDPKHVVVEIEDNGPGMDESIRRRIFEPFFTTKEPGVGTGLGLTVSYTIVTRNHRGIMEVASSPGRGARFMVRLPMMKEREDG